MAAVLYVFTALAAVVTLLPLSRGKAWWIRGWDFPRTQIAILAALVLAGYATLREPFEWGEIAGAAIATAVCLYQIVWIFPYTPLHRREVANAPGGGTRIRLLSANVLQTNRNSAALKRMIAARDPDLLLLLEANAWWQSEMNDVQRTLRHTLACPLDNLYGMLLYSRWPLEDARLQFLVEDDKPSIHAAVRLPDGNVCRLVCLHPAPPSPTENDESTERDAELILVARSMSREKRAAIVVGDLNDVAWSRTTRLFRKISRMLDPRVGRGLYNTFHARWFFMRWPVDHLFHTRHFTLGHLERLDAFGSDHFPVLAELVLADGDANDHALPDDGGDDASARDETRAAGKSADNVHVPQAR